MTGLPSRRRRSFCASKLKNTRRAVSTAMSLVTADRRASFEVHPRHRHHRPALAGMSRINPARFLFVVAVGSFLFAVCWLSVGYAVVARIGFSLFLLVVRMSAVQSENGAAPSANHQFTKFYLGIVHQDFQNLAISSRLRPFVSGTLLNTNKRPIRLKKA